MNNEQVKYVFVTGSSRSGTTMLSEVLRRHTEIYAHNEMHYFGDTFPMDSTDNLKDDDLVTMASWFLAREVNGIWRGQPNDEDRQRASEIVAQLPQHKRNGYQLYAHIAKSIPAANRKVHFCDHTPRNVFYASQILEQIPNAYFIHMIRDPRAELASQKSRWKRRWLDNVKIPMREVIRNWVSFHPYISSKLWQRAVNKSLSMKEHPRFLILKYEDLVVDAPNEVSALCEFLGVPYEADMLNVPVAGSSHATSRYQEKRISSDMVARWKKSLKPHEFATCERLTAKEMQIFGYLPEPNEHKSLVERCAMAGLVFTYPLHLLGAFVVSPRRAIVQLMALVRSRPA